MPFPRHAARKSDPSDRHRTPQRALTERKGHQASAVTLDNCELSSRRDKAITINP
jgi:hypothetical protein